MKQTYTVSVIDLYPKETASTNQDEINRKGKKRSRRYIGVLLALLSSFTFSLASLLVKNLTTSGGYHPFNIGLWRFIGIFTPYLPVVAYYCCVGKHKIIFQGVFVFNQSTSSKRKFKIWSLLLGRWITGASAIVLQFLSLKYLNLADSLVITFSTPVFVTLVSPLVLKEKWSFISIGLAIITLVGVGVMARPPIIAGSVSFDRDTLIGFAFALSSMVVTGMSFMLMQQLREVHYSVMLSLFGIWGTFECLVLTLLVGQLELPRNSNDWLMAVGLALLSVTAQTCLTLALKFEKAGPVSLIRTCDVVFGFIWQYSILGVEFDAISLAGQLIVMLGVIITISREWIRKLPIEDPVRLKLDCILH